MNVPDLKGSRVLLREFELQDLEAVFKYANDEETTRYMIWPMPETPEGSRPFLEAAVEAQQSDERRVYELAIVVEEEVVGGCGLHGIDFDHNSAELGYIIRRDMWGRGLMTEAARLLIDFGFAELGLHRIYATHDPENAASRRVMEKLGMRYEGLLRENLLIRGTYRDSEQRSILSTDQ